MTQVTALCGCGCDQPIEGRRSTRRYVSAACRKRAERARSRRDGPPMPRVDSEYAPVTVTRSRAVYCDGCGELVPKIEGPLPVEVYCRGCADGSEERLRDAARDRRER